MAMIDVLNPPTAPDSELDPDLSLEHLFPVNGTSGEHCMIAPGDWVDVNPSAIWSDPDWGFSFQVVNVYPEENQVGILVMDSWWSQTYSESMLSTDWITNNFRRVPKV